MKNAVFWDVAPCRLQSPAQSSSSLADLFLSTLTMEAIRSSETSVYTISKRRHIPEDGVLQQKHMNLVGHYRLFRYE
jgi:hypothetical protein